MAKQNLMQLYNKAQRQAIYDSIIYDALELSCFKVVDDTSKVITMDMLKSILDKHILRVRKADKIEPEKKRQDN